MIAQARRHRDRSPGPADLPWCTSGPAPHGDEVVAAADWGGRDSHSGRLAHSVDEPARLTGLFRDLLYDQMRRGNLAHVKVDRRCLITRQHLDQSFGIAY